MCFLTIFALILGGPDPSKSCSRVGESTIFTKSVFAILTPFWDNFLTIFGTILEPLPLQTYFFQVAKKHTFSVIFFFVFFAILVIFEGFISSHFEGFSLFWGFQICMVQRSALRTFFRPSENHFWTIFEVFWDGIISRDLRCFQLGFDHICEDLSRDIAKVGQPLEKKRWLGRPSRSSIDR